MRDNEVTEQCKHEQTVPQTLQVWGDIPHTRYWEECLLCGARFQEREQFHGPGWQGR